MDYNFSQNALDTIERIKNICREETKISNVFNYKGKKYLFTIGNNLENGSIIGNIIKINKSKMIKIDDFRIESNGVITKFLRFKEDFEKLF